METQENLLTRKRRAIDPQLAQSVMDLLRRSAPGGIPAAVPMAPAGPAIDPAKVDNQKIIAMLGGKAPLSTPSGIPNDSPDFRATQPTIPTVTAATGDETRPWKAGSAVGETNPLKRDAARIRAMIENPKSQVNPDGSVGVPHPMSKWKEALMGLVLGTAEGARNGGGWGNLIGGGAGGLAVGLGKPGAVQEWRRRMEVADEQSHLEEQQKLQQRQAQIGEIQAQTQQRQMAPEIAAAELAQKAAYDRERLRIQQETAAGRKTAAEAANELRVLEMKQRSEEGEKNRANQRTIAGMRGTGTTATDVAAAEGEALATSTVGAADELKKELDSHKGQLTENERAITQKEAGWKTQAAKVVADSGGQTKFDDALEQVKAADPDYSSGTYDQTVNNTKALRGALTEKEKRYAAMQEDVRKAQAKGARRQRPAGPTLKAPPPPPNVSEASVRAAAKARNQDPENAVKRARELGWIQ